MGDTGGRILGTSLLATGTAMVAMVQLPALSDRRIGWVPIVAIGAAALGFALVTAAIWGNTDSDLGWKVAGTAYTVAVAGAILALLAGQRIQGPAAWVGTASMIATGVAAGMLIIALWLDVNDGFWRLFAVLSVLVAAGGLAVPILSRSADEDHATIDYCPFCGADLGSRDAGDVTCPSCERRFAVKPLA